MTRLYGRAPRGKRLVCKVPFGAWKTMTFIAALRHDRLTAPMLLDGPMTGQSFIAYVEQMLAPTLKRGDILVMDNVPTHRVRGVREAVAIRGVNVPEFPPYSPDLNPIEQSFAKLKALLRKAGARSPRQISTAIASALKHFSAAECAAYLAHDAMVNLIGKCSKYQNGVVVCCCHAPRGRHGHDAVRKSFEDLDHCRSLRRQIEGHRMTQACNPCTYVGNGIGGAAMTI